MRPVRPTDRNPRPVRSRATERSAGALSPGPLLTRASDPERRRRATSPSRGPRCRRGPEAATAPHRCRGGPRGRDRPRDASASGDRPRAVGASPATGSPRRRSCGSQRRRAGPYRQAPARGTQRAAKTLRGRRRRESCGSREAAGPGSTGRVVLSRSEAHTLEFGRRRSTTVEARSRRCESAGTHMGGRQAAFNSRGLEEERRVNHDE